MDDWRSYHGRRPVTVVRYGPVERVSKHEIRVLGLVRDQPCVSLFLPTYRAGAEVQQNPIRLKNLLREAHERLVADGRRASEVEELLRPAEELVGNSPFWQHQREGLALFLSPNFFRTYRLPVETQQRVVVRDRFYVRPLLRLLTGYDRFYVLALSLKGVRLFTATRFEIEELEVELPGPPLERLLREADSPQRHLQYHTRVPRGGRAGARRGGLFHGHGEDVEDERGRIVRFFKQVDRELAEARSEARGPVVLAGVESVVAMYRETSDAPEVLEETIEGSPDKLAPHEVHAKAWRIVEPHFRAGQEEALARFRELAGTGKASAEAEEVVLAAHHSRVERLFVGIGAELWGRADPDEGRVEVHESEPDRGEELVEVAALQTILNGGLVDPVEPQSMPEGAPLAAIFRF